MVRLHVGGTRDNVEKHQPETGEHRSADEGEIGRALGIGDRDRPEGAREADGGEDAERGEQDADRGLREVREAFEHP